MRLGRRFELLMANATRKLSLARRSELLEELTQWVESECSAADNEELFWMLGAAMAIQMGNYCEQVQAQIGGEILEKEMRNSEQPSEAPKQAHVLRMRTKSTAGKRSRQEIHAGNEAEKESRSLPAMSPGSHAVGEKREPGKLKKRKRGQQINRVRINF